MIEEFRDIPGFDGMYKASNMGSVISVGRTIMGRHIKGRQLKPLNANGVVKVNLSLGRRSESTTKTIGYLILLTFVGEPPDEVNIRARHRNNNYKDNRLENLYWGPHQPGFKKGWRKTC